MRHQKTYIAGTILFLSAVPFWYLYQMAIEGGSFEGLTAIYAFLALTIFLILSSILFLFSERSDVVFFALLIAGLPAVFLLQPSGILAAGVLLFAASGIYAHTRVRAEAEHRLTFAIPILLRQGLPIVLTTLSLLLAIGYYGETRVAPERITIQDILPKPVVTGILRSVTPQNTEIDRNIFYELVTQRTEQLLEPYQQFVPLAFAVAFFLFLRTVALPYGWLVGMLTAAMVKGLVRSGLATRAFQEKQQERIQWS